MKILSRGDRISEGHYTVHSRFERVVNYNSNCKLLSFVSAAIGNGPVNIVIESKLRALPAEILILPDKFVFGIESIDISDIPVYDSKLKILHSEQTILKENLDALKQTLASHASEYSLAFLFDEQRKLNFATGFEKNLLETFENAIAQLRKGEIEPGIQKLSGLGQGLTPAGDDFIVGILLALNLTDAFSGNEKSRELQMRIKSMAQTKNLISQSSIVHAADGYFAEIVKIFAQSFCNKRFSENDALILQLLNVGESSGADMLSGFLFTFVSDKFHGLQVKI
ncbi:MAG: DUF2877 domain-containing protein [Bacteroidota bacterium]